MVVSWLIVVCWLVGCLLLIGMVEVPTDRNFGAIGLGLTLASELAEMNPWAILLCGAEPMPLDLLTLYVGLGSLSAVTSVVNICLLA